MSIHCKAIYRNGAFVVIEPCDIPQESEVDLIVQGPLVVPAPVKNPAERSRILHGVVDRMRNNPLPASAPRFSREQLHERR